MARKKSLPRKLFTRLIWVIWTVMAGGSVVGWLAPTMPVVGPIVQRVIAKVAPQSKLAHSLENRSLETSEVSSEQSSQTVGGGLANAQVPQTSGAQVPVSLVSSRKPLGTITVASFNIQVFGTSKLAKPHVVDVLAKVVRHFDVVAIQEVRSKDDSILPRFVAAVNADGSRYGYTIGPRLGRSVSKEQYVFLYDVNRIEIDRSSIGNMTDPDDLLHREPFVARFHARLAGAGAPFSFWLINIHTDPDEVPTEVDALADVFQVMRHARPDEDDVILLGDLNASDQQFGRLGQIPGMTWAVHGKTTNTRGTKMYDNLLFERTATSEYTGRWGVFDLESAFGLTREQALEVSDHLPIWAEFRNLETSQHANVAAQPNQLGQGVRRY